jgi:hypothetical protein
MFAKGIIEGKIAVEMLGAGKTSLITLVIGIGSLAKKFIFNQIPFFTFLRQSAHRAGFFWGSRQVSRP